LSLSAHRKGSLPQLALLILAHMNASLFPWLRERSSGVLLHITSLPSDLGIGNLGKQAYRFIDFLEATGMRYWQLCPLGPTGFGDSPYQSFSSFAGNPYFIDLHPLIADGLLSAADLQPLHEISNKKVDYASLYARFFPIMHVACERFAEQQRNLSEYGNFDKFVQAHRSWLLPYAAFSALKHHYNGQPWYTWPEENRSFKKFRQSALFGQLEPKFMSTYFEQYLFFGQLAQLRRYAHEKGIQFIGDIPIFVSPDSADIWANPHLFQLDKHNKKTAVAGVPPDYFSSTGQLWGNPLYDWQANADEDYQWWIQRLAHQFKIFDVVRLDHFRGFHEYWSIPAGAKDATSGKWIPGPQMNFFKAVQQAMPDAQLIAEDLGEATPGLFEFREETGLPGMAILQFAFGGGADNSYLPHNLERNCVMYPGTHDNNTTIGWYAEAPQNVAHHMRTYFQTDGKAPNWEFIRATYASVARMGIIPLQDLMGLDASARLNIPGTPQDNWQWRFSSWQLDQLWNQQAGYLKSLKETYNR